MIHQAPAQQVEQQITYSCKYERGDKDFRQVQGADSAESAVRYFLWMRRYASGRVIVMRSDGQLLGPYHIGRPRR
jgi:hypothetical protein